MLGLGESEAELDRRSPICARPGSGCSRSASTSSPRPAHLAGRALGDAGGVRRLGRARPGARVPRGRGRAAGPQLLSRREARRTYRLIRARSPILRPMPGQVIQVKRREHTGLVERLYLPAIVKGLRRHEPALLSQPARLRHGQEPHGLRGPVSGGARRLSGCLPRHAGAGAARERPAQVRRLRSVRVRLSDGLHQHRPGRARRARASSAIPRRSTSTCRAACSAACARRPARRRRS